MDGDADRRDRGREREAIMDGADDCEPELRLPAFGHEAVPAVDIASLRANWKSMSGEPAIAIGCVLRSIVLGAAWRDEAFRKRWADPDGEPSEIVLQAAASLNFTYSGSRSLDRRIKRLQHRAARIAAGKEAPSPIAMTAEMRAQLLAEAEAEFGPFDAAIDLDLGALDRLIGE